MSDSVGTNGAVYWLERLESALYSQVFEAVCAGDVGTAVKWTDVLERLGII